MEESEFIESSVKSICPDCKLGHCSCYYTNANRCCRCSKYQNDRKLIDRKINYDEPAVNIYINAAQSN